MKSKLPRASRAAVATALALAVAPAAASAATVSVDGSVLRYATAAGETDRPTIHRRDPNVFVVDGGYGATLTAGAGCTQQGQSAVECAGAPVKSIAADLGDREPGALFPAGTVFPETLTVTADVRVPASMTAAEGSGARVRYSEERPVTVTLDGQANDGPPGRGDNVGAGFAGVYGGDGADTVTGDAGDNFVDAGSGDDTIALGAGDDTVVAAYYEDVGTEAGLYAYGKDRIACGDGRDRVYVDEGDLPAADCEEVVKVTEGRVTYTGTDGPDELLTGYGPAFVYGRAGNDRLTLGVYDYGTLFGQAGDDRLAAGDGSGRLSGGSGHDLILGGDADDVLTGGSGRDRLDGGAGNDMFNARDRQYDRIRCGTGRDRVTADRGDYVYRGCESIRRG